MRVFTLKGPADRRGGGVGPEKTSVSRMPTEKPSGSARQWRTSPTAGSLAVSTQTVPEAGASNGILKPSPEFEMSLIIPVITLVPRSPITIHGPGYIDGKSRFAPQRRGFGGEVDAGEISFGSQLAIGDLTFRSYAIERSCNAAAGLNPSIGLEMQLAIADSEQSTVEFRTVAAQQGDRDTVRGFSRGVSHFDRKDHMY